MSFFLFFNDDKVWYHCVWTETQTKASSFDKLISEGVPNMSHTRTMECYTNLTPDPMWIHANANLTLILDAVLTLKGSHLLFIEYDE